MLINTATTWLDICKNYMFIRPTSTAQTYSSNIQYFVSCPCDNNNSMQFVKNTFTPKRFTENKSTSVQRFTMRLQCFGGIFLVEGLIFSDTFCTIAPFQHIPKHNFVNANTIHYCHSSVLAFEHDCINKTHFVSRMFILVYCTKIGHYIYLHRIVSQLEIPQKCM